MRVRLIGTKYVHWGEYSGFSQLTKYFDPNIVDIDLYMVPDDDSQFPQSLSLVRNWIKNYIKQSGMSWYKLSDLSAECNTLFGIIKKNMILYIFLIRNILPIIYQILLRKLDLNAQN